MNKKLLRIRNLSFLLLLLLSSCNNDNDLSINKSNSKVVDLNNFTFSEVKSILSSGSAVMLKDGGKEIPIAHFDKDENVAMATLGGAVTLFHGNDSVSISLCDSFVSIRIGKEGPEFGYVSYADTKEMSRVMNAYAKKTIVTKASDSPVILSETGSSMKINITGAQQANAIATKGSTDNSMDDNVEVTPGMEKEMNAKYGLSSIQTKASAYRFPRNKTVTIHLLISSGAYEPISHELVWQEEKAQASISDIFRNDNRNAPKLVFVVEKCAFNSTENASNDLSNFKDFVYNNSAKYSTVGKDVFFLVRQWGWNQSIVGKAYCSTYNINTLNNSYSFGISATSCLYPTTLVHELGHVFGVNDHSTTPWYRLNKDVMNATQHVWVGCYHHTDINQGSSYRNAIYNRLKQL